MNDILFSNGFIFRNGDFAIGDSLIQETEAILRATKGTFIHAPLVGFGIVQRLNSPMNEVEFRQDLKAELQRDGMKLDKLFFDVDSQGKRQISVSAKR